MRRIKAAILTAILAGTSIADEPPLDRYQGCWKTNLPDNGITNTIVFCIDGQSIEVRILYANPGLEPTTCRSSGRIESIDSTTLAIRTGQGTCENRNSLAPSEWTCTFLNDNELNCLNRDFNQLHLNRENAEEYGR